jgi:hypothetical protein
MIGPRPHSLAEVARRTNDARDFEYELADFLHEFALRGDAAMLCDPPELLHDRCPQGTVYDAYLAAVAASLSSRLKHPAPAWTRHPERILREPWFASPSRHMRALLFVESPAAFRERNLFVTANALSVA